VIRMPEEIVEALAFRGTQNEAQEIVIEPFVERVSAQSAAKSMVLLRLWTRTGQGVWMRSDGSSFGKSW